MSSEPATRSAVIEVLEGRRLLSLSPAVDYPTIGTPSFIVTADFNNDGKLDLATCANAFTGSVSVLLGDGAGGFGAAQRTIVGSYLTSMAVADFDSDGKLDIVAADWSYSLLHLLKGNGDGTFQPVVSRPQMNFVDAVSVGQFNNDAHADLLVRLWDWDSSANIFQVQLGDGQGNFTDPVLAPYVWDHNGGSGQAAVDLNNDGKLDVVTADVDGFLGDGNGTLHEPSYTAAGGGAVATGDFTGDGKADAISVGNGVLGVLRGKGDGTFHPSAHHTANGTNHTAVAIADLNGDGKLDAVVTDFDVATASVMLGNGDGTLGYFGAYVTGTSPSGVAIGDFNRDGRPDVAVSSAGFRSVSVLLNDGEWQTPPPPPPAPPELSISDVTVTEGDAGTQNAAFTLTLSRAPTVQASVYYNAAGITAEAGSDFEGTSGMVIFAPGETSKTVPVAVKGDLLPEPTETFAVNLLLPNNLRIADAQGIGTIIDDDLVPTIVISNVSRAEGNAGTTPFAFTVSLSSASDQPVQVGYTTAGGTASSSGGNRDFHATSGTIQFAAGQTSRTVSVSVVGDTRAEPDETFFVNLSQPVGATITDGQGLGTILNDDSGRGKRWVGPSSGGSWSDASNWSPSGVPVDESLVAIAGASVSLPGSATVGELYLSDGATLSLAPEGNRVFRTAGLFLDAGARLDLADNSMILDPAVGADTSFIRHQLASAHNGGAWDGFGITSSAAAAVPGSGIGFAAADELFGAFPAAFAGQSVDRSSILLRYTVLGDATADRVVNLADFAILAANFNQSGRTFARGNFDYDLAGHVTLGDFAILAANFNRTLGALDAAATARPGGLRLREAAAPREPRRSGWEELWMGSADLP